MPTPKISVGVTGNIFVRQMHFANAGDDEQGHEHPYDHMTLLAKGRFSVEVEGETSEFTAPHMLWVRADRKHKITALTPDAVAYCIHGLRDGNESDDIIAPDMVPRGSALRQMMLKTRGR